MESCEWESCEPLRLGSAVAKVSKSAIRGAELRLYQRVPVCVALSDSNMKTMAYSTTCGEENEP